MVRRTSLLKALLFFSLLLGGGSAQAAILMIIGSVDSPQFYLDATAAKKFSEKTGQNILILGPERNDWHSGDTSWAQRLSNDDREAYNKNLPTIDEKASLDNIKKALAQLHDAAPDEPLLLIISDHGGIEKKKETREVRPYVVLPDGKEMDYETLGSALEESKWSSGKVRVVNAACYGGEAFALAKRFPGHVCGSSATTPVDIGLIPFEGSTHGVISQSLEIMGTDLRASLRDVQDKDGFLDNELMSRLSSTLMMEEFLKAGPFSVDAFSHGGFNLNYLQDTELSSGDSGDLYLAWWVSQGSKKGFYLDEFFHFGSFKDASDVPTLSCQFTDGEAFNLEIEVVANGSKRIVSLLRHRESSKIERLILDGESTQEALRWMSVHKRSARRELGRINADLDSLTREYLEASHGPKPLSDAEEASFRRRFQDLRSMDAAPVLKEFFAKGARVRRAVLYEKFLAANPSQEMIEKVDQTIQCENEPVFQK